MCFCTKSVFYCKLLMQYSQYLNIKIKILPQGSHFDRNINTVHFPSLSYLAHFITHFPTLCCCHHHHLNHHSHSLFHSSLTESQKSNGHTDQAHLIHCSAKNFLTMSHVLSITACCIRIYRAILHFHVICLG
jgi:hypothetical protein